MIFRRWLMREAAMPVFELDDWPVMMDWLEDDFEARLPAFAEWFKGVLTPIRDELQGLRQSFTGWQTPPGTIQSVQNLYYEFSRWVTFTEMYIKTSKAHDFLLELNANQAAVVQVVGQHLESTFRKSLPSLRGILERLGQDAFHPHPSLRKLAAEALRSLGGTAQYLAFFEALPAGPRRDFGLRYITGTKYPRRSIGYSLSTTKMLDDFDDLFDTSAPGYQGPEVDHWDPRRGGMDEILYERGHTGEVIRIRDERRHTIYHPHGRNWWLIDQPARPDVEVTWIVSPYGPTELSYLVAGMGLEYDVFGAGQ